jgi:hypothetical protein
VDSVGDVDRFRSEFDPPQVEWEGPVAAGVALAGDLETLHRSGRLHGSISPDAVQGSAGAEARLLDPAQVPAGAGVAHLAPERLAGGAPSVPSDVYALGSTVHAMIRAQAPPASERHHGTDPADLQALGVPAAVDRALRQALQVDPSRRPESALAFGESLRLAQVVLGVPAPAIAVAGRVRPAPAWQDAPAPAPAEGVSWLPPASGAAPPQRGRRPALVAAGALILVAGGVTGVAGWLSRTPAEVRGLPASVTAAPTTGPLGGSAGSPESGDGATLPPGAGASAGAPTRTVPGGTAGPAAGVNARSLPTVGGSTSGGSADAVPSAGPGSDSAPRPSLRQGQGTARTGASPRPAPLPTTGSGGTVGPRGTNPPGSTQPPAPTTEPPPPTTEPPPPTTEPPPPTTEPAVTTPPTG